MNINLLLLVRRKLLPLGLMLVVSLMLAGGLLWLNQISSVSANTSDIALAESTYPTIVGSRIDNCALCHSSVPSLNPFGSAYKSGGRGLATSLTNIANTDSDGDGYSNLQEINAHTYPGDRLDFPMMTPTATSTTAPSATATTAPSATSTMAATATSTMAATATATTAPSVTSTTAPTATKPAPTATRVGPTATKPAATATRAGPTATKPAVTATPIKNCIKDDDDYREREKERLRFEGKKRHNPCPHDTHPRRERDRERGDVNNSSGDLGSQVLASINGWFLK